MTCSTSAKPPKTTCSASLPTPACGPRITKRTRRPPDQGPAENIRPPHQRRRHPGPPRHQKLHRHRTQTRPRHPHRPAQHLHRRPLAATRTSRPLVPNPGANREPPKSPSGLSSFLDTPGSIINTSTTTTVRIDRRAHSPVLRQADLPADTTGPWWHGRRLHFEFT
jgi:hypothetical protein